MLDDLKHYDRGLVANFVRLLKDAELLRNHQRYQSAYALGLIALEEIAKVILVRWETMYPNLNKDRRRNQHLTKQAALTCLLVADSLAPEYDYLMADDEPWRQKMPQVDARDLAVMWEAHAGKLQIKKHLALYYDIWANEGPPASEQFTLEAVNEVFAYARRAVMLTANGRAMVLALGLYHAIKDEPADSNLLQSGA